MSECEHAAKSQGIVATVSDRAPQNSAIEDSGTGASAMLWR